MSFYAFSCFIKIKNIINACLKQEGSKQANKEKTFYLKMGETIQKRKYMYLLFCFLCMFALVDKYILYFHSKYYNICNVIKFGTVPTSLNMGYMVNKF